MSRDIDDLDDAIDEQSDLIRELRRTPECAIRAEEAENVLSYMVAVRQKALQYKELASLLNAS